MNSHLSHRKIAVSIGLLAHNDEARLSAALSSLFRQNLFAELDRQGLRAEIWCVAHGCGDNTAAMAENFFLQQSRSHPHADAFLAHAVSIAAPGRANAWNLLIHEITSRESHGIILMDAGVTLGHVTTLWNLFNGLQSYPAAHIAVGDPVQDLALKRSPSIDDRIALATSPLTHAANPRLTDQLYCIRTSTARRIRLPRDLVNGEEAFLRTLVTTHFLTLERPVAGIQRVPGASYLMETPGGLSKAVEREKDFLIGETVAYVLQHHFESSARRDGPEAPAQEIGYLDEQYSDWLRKLVAAHIEGTRHFWRIFPGACALHFHRWRRLNWRRMLRILPGSVMATAISFVAARRAYSEMRAEASGTWTRGEPQSASSQSVADNQALSR